MITFDYPLVLLCLAVFIPLVLFDVYSIRAKAIYRNLPKSLRTKLFVSRLLFRLFLGCGIIALAGPRWGMGESAGEYRRMVDAVIALDVSRSMEVLDGQNGDISRLERGLSIVRAAIVSSPGTRFATTVSRNRGTMAIPLTWDNEVVLAFLDAMGTSGDMSTGVSITGRGTNLESLIDAAAGTFQTSYPAARMILLVSDGEALSGTLKAALERCNQKDIRIVAIAVGSDEGGIVPGGDDIHSRRDPGAMRMAAQQTGGMYIDGNREDAAVSLTAYMRSLAPESEIRNREKEPRTRWFMFALLAIITLGASKLSVLRIGRQ